MGGRSIYSWEVDDSRRRRRVNAQPLSALNARDASDSPPAPRAYPGTFGAWRQRANPEPPAYGPAPAYTPNYTSAYDGGYPHTPQPAYQPPTYQQPTYQEPTYQPPAYQPPNYQQPNYQQPNYQQPNYQQPNYQQPPSYQPPSYQPPSYQPPSYQQPSYQQPSYQPPSYQEPPPHARQADGRDSAWLTDQAPVAPRQRTAFWPAVAGQGYRPPQPAPRPPEDDESWLQDTQEDQAWEYHGWQERSGGYRPERERPSAYSRSANNPWDQRRAPHDAYREAHSAQAQYPSHYAEENATHHPYGAHGAYGAYAPQGGTRGWEAHAAANWTASQRDEYSGGYSGNYAGYDEDADPGIWDEDTEELSAPASAPRFVNMRERAAAMSGLAAEWGRVRPAMRLPAQSHRLPGLRRLARRHHRSEVKLPPFWVMLNMLILLAVGVIVAPHVFAAESHSCAWYTAQSGDTIPSLAQRYHATAKSIYDANHLTASQQLTIGQHICIPNHASSDTVIAAVVPAPSATATPKPTPTPTPTPAKPAPAPPSGSVSGAKAFIQFVLPYAKRAHADTGWPTSMIIAQWGVEHGWKLPSFTGYNFGNVASVPGEPTVPGTAAKGSPSHFSYAKTPEDGLRQYLKVAHLKYYEPVTAASKSGANAAAIALGKSPWDAGHYGGAGNPGSSLLGVMKSFNLYAYD